MQRFNLLMAAFLALIMVLPAAAQVNLGIIGGPNFSNASGEAEDGTKIEFSGRTGLGIGGVLDLAISENASLVFQPMYLQKGAKQSEQGVEFIFCGGPLHAGADRYSQGRHHYRKRIGGGV